MARLKGSMLLRLRRYRVLLAKMRRTTSTTPNNKDTSTKEGKTSEARKASRRKGANGSGLTTVYNVSG